MAQAHARSGQVISLYPGNRVSAPERTTAILKAEQLEVIQLVLAAGKTLPEHQVAGEITLLGLTGTIVLRTSQGEQLLGPGDFIHMRGGEPHTLTARDDATALLTISLSAQAGVSCASARASG
jgi:quercetin dioxygenase-like cupin family protein